jgi:prepilin-type processing-associated H-X9-DG protein
MNSFMGARPDSAGTIPPDATAYVPYFSRDSELTKPSSLFVFVEEDARTISTGFFITDPSALIWFSFPAISSVRHSFSYNIGMADGSASSWRIRDPKTFQLVSTQTEQLGNADLQALADAASVFK